MRRRAIWLEKIFWTSGAALLAIAAASPSIAAPREKVIRTPSKSWDRSYDPNQERLTMINAARAEAISMVVSSGPLAKADIPSLVMKVTGQSIQGARRRWPQETLDKAEVDYGVSFTLADGRKGMYVEIWRRTRDGRNGITGYLVIATEFDDRHAADFKRIVRASSNQLARGAVLQASLQPSVNGDRAPIIANLPPVSSPAPVIAAGPAVSTSVTSSAPVVVPAAVSAATTYPFIAAAGAGVSVNQIANVLYAPLESSEVFVLFKDGSFHENLPVALEQWNMAASRSKDPGSWGKWKAAEDAGDFEMQYSTDDVVTISATKIKPAKGGMLIDGSFAKATAAADNEDTVRFAGNRFEIVRNGTKDGGTYRVDGYSIVLTHDDGRIEHQPFFIVPPEEADDEPSIWLGDSLLERVN
jgi:hypothetical protein